MAGTDGIKAPGLSHSSPHGSIANQKHKPRKRNFFIFFFLEWCYFVKSTDLTNTVKFRHIEAKYQTTSHCDNILLLKSTETGVD